MKVVELVRTCYACPSQWDAKLDDGRHAYFRYRWGNFTATVGDDYKSAVSGEVVVEFDLGSGYDGHMSDEVLMFELSLRGWEFDTGPASFSEEVFDGFSIGPTYGVPEVDDE